MVFDKKRIYLDWAAAAPVSVRAGRAFLASLSLCGNPGALHAEAREARALLEESRRRIARLAEVREEGVVFTSGATEANALAILGFVRAVPKKSTSTPHVLYHPGAHASSVQTVQALGMEGVEIEPIALADGHVDLERLQAQLKGETALVVLEAVCGETGIRTDTLGVRRVLDAYGKEKGNRIRLQVDASQAPLTLPFTLAHLGADMVTLDAQKVGGVRGIGALLMRQGITLQPLTHGGAQEHGLRPGTESPALALAFAVALEEVQEERASFTTRATHMRGALIEKISVIPHLEINEQGNCIPHILSVSLLGRDTDYAVMLLDVEGYAVSTKSACETDEEGSRAVTLQFGIERGKSTLRVSWGPATPQRDLHTFADALIRTVRFLDETAL